jgi:rubrerythrin
MNKPIDYKLVRASIANGDMNFTYKCDAVKEYPRIEENSKKYEELMTPKEPNDGEWSTEWNGDTYQCRVCGIDKIWKGFKHCPMCGQKLKWAESEESKR